ncbi:MAG: hypothetical protein JSV16_01150 [Candidatus Hydrogenedentota bacterium]|nr:MAG: hypothetical protein JSV16_01150 [Candidatus Hydrogenedentota bacterium]
MPIYGYECKRCAEVFERVRSNQDRPPSRAPLAEAGKYQNCSARSGFQSQPLGWAS